VYVSSSQECVWFLECMCVRLSLFRLEKSLNEHLNGDSDEGCDQKKAGDDESRKKKVTRGCDDHIKKTNEGIGV